MRVSGASHFSLRLLALAFAVIFTCTALTGLGIWQIERRAWKLGLIAQVDQRIHAAPVSAPGPETWDKISTVDAYRHVALHGMFLNDHETAVHAVTNLGSGYWILTPFKSDDGFIVLVNRGFVPPERREAATHETAEGPTTVTGLLRLTEPKGGFLRANNPASGQWYSRDVAAIAAAQNISGAAPYFIDEDAGINTDTFPIGGLTVTSFPNNHLVYALTWFGLALMIAIMGIIALRQEYRGRR